MKQLVMHRMVLLHVACYDAEVAVVVHQANKSQYSARCAFCANQSKHVNAIWQRVSGAEASSTTGGKKKNARFDDKTQKPLAKSNSIDDLLAHKER